MRMDRNINADGGGKYAIVNMRALREAMTPGGRIEEAFQRLRDAGIIDLGMVGTESEFFLIKLKDRHSPPALYAYADSIRPTDPEFAAEVTQMCFRAGERSPWCKEPD